MNINAGIRNHSRRLRLCLYGVAFEVCAMWTCVRKERVIVPVSLIATITMQLILFPDDPYQASLRLRLAYWGYAFIIILGTIPGARAEVGEVASGFFLHFTAYACMTALLFTGYRGNAGIRAMRSIAIVAAMGALDEIIQSFLPYRNGTIRDWYVDVAAAIVSSVILAQLYLRARR